MALWQNNSSGGEIARFERVDFRRTYLFKFISLFIIFTFLVQNLSYASIGFAIPAKTSAPASSVGFLNRLVHVLSKDASAKAYHEEGVFTSEHGTFVDVSAGTDLTKYDSFKMNDSSAITTHMYTQNDMVLNLDNMNAANNFVASGGMDTGVAGQWEVPVVMTSPTTIGSDFSDLAQMPSTMVMPDLPDGISATGYEAVEAAMNVNWDDGAAPGFQGVAYYSDQGSVSMGGNEMTITNTLIQNKEYLNNDLGRQTNDGGGKSEYWHGIRAKENVLSKFNGGHEYNLYNTNTAGIARFELGRAGDTFSVSSNGARAMIGDKLRVTKGTHEATQYNGLGQGTDQYQILSGLGNNELARKISYGTHEGEGYFTVSALGNIDFDPQRALGTMWGLPGADNAVQLSKNHFYYSASSGLTKFIADGSGNNMAAGGSVDAILKDTFKVIDGDKELVFTPGTGFHMDSNSAVGFMGAGSTASWKGQHEATFAEALFHDKGKYKFEDGSEASIFQPLLKTSAFDKLHGLAPEAQDALPNITSNYLGNFSQDKMVETEGDLAAEPDMDFQQVLNGRYREALFTAGDDKKSFVVEAGEKGLHAGWNLHTMNTNAGKGLAYAVNVLGHKVDYTADKALEINNNGLLNNYQFGENSSWGMGKDANGNDTAAKWTNMSYHAKADNFTQNYDMNVTGFDGIINRRHEITGLDVTADFNDYGNTDWTVNDALNEIKVINSFAQEQTMAVGKLIDVNSNGTEILGFSQLSGTGRGFSAETTEMDILAKAAGKVAIDPRLDAPGDKPAALVAEPGLIGADKLMERNALPAGSLGKLTYFDDLYKAELTSGQMTWDALGSGQSDLGAGLVDAIQYNKNKHNVNSYVDRAGFNKVILYGESNPGNADSELIKHSNYSASFAGLGQYGYAGKNGAFVNAFNSIDYKMYKTGDIRRADDDGYVLGPQAGQANMFFMLPDLLGDKVFIAGAEQDGGLHFQWQVAEGKDLLEGSLAAVSGGEEQYLINPETELSKTMFRSISDNWVNGLTQSNITDHQKNRLKTLANNVLAQLKTGDVGHQKALEILTKDTMLNVDVNAAEQILDGAYSALEQGSARLDVIGEIHGKGAWRLDGETLTLRSANTKLLSDPSKEIAASAVVKRFDFTSTQKPNSAAIMQRTYSFSDHAGTNSFKVHTENSFEGARLDQAGRFGLSGTLPYFSKVTSSGGGGKSPTYNGIVDVNSMLSPSGNDMSLFNRFTFKVNERDLATLDFDDPSQFESVMDKKISQAAKYNIGNRTSNAYGEVSFGASGNGHRVLDGGTTITRGDKGQLIYEEGTYMRSLMGELSYKTAEVGDTKMSAWSVYSPHAQFDYVNLNAGTDKEANYVWRPDELSLSEHDVNAGSMTVKQDGKTFLVDFDRVLWSDSVGIINSWGGNGLQIQTGANGVVVSKKPVEYLPLTISFTNVYHKTPEQLEAMEAARAASEALSFPPFFPAPASATAPAIDWTKPFWETGQEFSMLDGIPEDKSIDHDAYHSVLEYVGLSTSLTGEKGDIEVNILGTDSGTGENRRIGFAANVDQVEMRSVAGMQGTRLAVEQGPTVSDVESRVNVINVIPKFLRRKELIKSHIETNVDHVREDARDYGLTFVDHTGMARTIFDGAINIDYEHGLLMDHGTGLWENKINDLGTSGGTFEQDNFGIFADDFASSYVGADEFRAKMILNRINDLQKDHSIELPSALEIENALGVLGQKLTQTKEYENLIGNMSEEHRYAFGQVMSKTMEAFSDHLKAKIMRHGDKNGWGDLMGDANSVTGDFFKLDDSSFEQFANRDEFRDYFINTLIRNFQQEGFSDLSAETLQALDADGQFFTKIYQHWQSANASLSDSAQGTGSRNIARMQGLLGQAREFVSDISGDRETEGPASAQENKVIKISEKNDITQLILANGRYRGKNASSPAWFKRTSDGDWDIGDGSAQVHGFIEQTLSSSELGQRVNDVVFKDLHFDKNSRRLSSAAITGKGRMWTAQSIFNKGEASHSPQKETAADDVPTRARAHSRGAIKDDFVSQSPTAGTDFFIGTSLETEKDDDQLVFSLSQPGFIPTLSFKADGTELRIGEDDVFWMTDSVDSDAAFMQEGSFVFSNELSLADSKRDEISYGRALGRAGRHQEANDLAKKDYGFSSVKDKTSALRFERDEKGNVLPTYNAVTQVLYKHTSHGEAVNKDNDTGEVTNYGTIGKEVVQEDGTVKIEGALEMTGLRFPSMDGKSFIGHGGSLDVSGSLYQDGEEVAEFVVAGSTEKRNQDGKLVGLVTGGLVAKAKNLKLESTQGEIINDLATNAHAKKEDYKTVDLDKVRKARSGSSSSSSQAAANHSQDNGGVALSAGMVSKVENMDYDRGLKRTAHLSGMHMFEYRGVNENGVQIKDTIGMQGNTIMMTAAQKETFFAQEGGIFAINAKGSNYIFVSENEQGIKEMVFLDMKVHKKNEIKQMIERGDYAAISELTWLTKDQFVSRHGEQAASDESTWVHVSQGKNTAMVRSNEVGRGNARVRDVNGNIVKIEKNNLPAWFDKREKINKSFDTKSSANPWDEGALFVMQGLSGYKVGIMPEIHAVAPGLVQAQAPRRRGWANPMKLWDFASSAVKHLGSKEAELLNGANGVQTIRVKSKALPKSWKRRNPDFGSLTKSIGAGDPNADAGNAYVTRYMSVEEFRKTFKGLNRTEKAEAEAYLRANTRNGRVRVLLNSEKLGAAGEKMGWDHGDDVALFDENGNEIGSMDGGRALWMDGDINEQMQQMFKTNEGYKFEDDINNGLARNNFRLAGGDHTWYIEGHSFERMMYQMWAQSNGNKDIAALASTVLSQNDSAQEFSGNVTEMGFWIAADVILATINVVGNVFGIGVVIPDEFATAAAVVKTGTVIKRVKGVTNITRGMIRAGKLTKLGKATIWAHRTVRSANQMGLAVGAYTAGKQVITGGFDAFDLGAVAGAFNSTARTSAMLQGGLGGLNAIAKIGFVQKAVSLYQGSAAVRATTQFAWGGGLAGYSAHKQGVDFRENTGQFAAHVVAGGLTMIATKKLMGGLQTPGRAISISSGLAASMPGAANHAIDASRGVDSKFTYSSHVGNFFTGMIAGSVVGASGMWMDNLSRANSKVWTADAAAKNKLFETVTTFAKSKAGIGWLASDLAIDVFNKGQLFGMDINPIYGGVISDTMANGLHQFNNVVGMYLLSHKISQKAKRNPHDTGDPYSEDVKEMGKSLKERYFKLGADGKIGFHNFRYARVISWGGASAYALGGKDITVKLFGKEEGEDLHRAISMASLGALILGPGLTDHRKLYDGWFAGSGGVMGANKLGATMIQQGAQLAPRLATFQPFMEGVLKPMVYSTLRDGALSNWAWGKKAANWVFEMDLVSDDQFNTLNGVSDMSYDQLMDLAQREGLNIENKTVKGRELSREQYREEVIKGIMQKNGSENAAYLTTAAGLGMNVNNRKYDGYMGYFKLQKDIKMNEIAQKMSTVSGQEREMFKSMLFESASADVYTSSFDHLATTAFEGAKTSVTFGPVMHFVKPVLSAGLRTMPILGDVQDFGQIIFKDGEIVKRLKLKGTGKLSAMRSITNRGIDKAANFMTFFSEESLREPLTDIYVGAVARNLGGGFAAPQRADYDSEAVYQQELSKHQQWREWFQEAFDGDGGGPMASNIINKSTDNLMRNYTHDNSRVYASDSKLRQSINQNTSSTVSLEEVGISSSFVEGAFLNGQSFATGNSYKGPEFAMAQTAPNTFEVDFGDSEEEISQGLTDNGVVLQSVGKFRLELGGEGSSVVRSGNKFTVTMDKSSQAKIKLNKTEYASIDLQNDFQRLDITRGRSSSEIKVQAVDGLSDAIGQNTHFDIQNATVYFDSSLENRTDIVKSSIEQQINSMNADFSSNALFDYLGQDFVGIKIDEEFVNYENFNFSSDFQSQLENFYMLSDEQKTKFLSEFKELQNQGDVALVFGDKDNELDQSEVEVDGQAFQKLEKMKKKFNYSLLNQEDVVKHMHSDKLNNADRIAAEEFLVEQMSDEEKVGLLFGNDVTFEIDNQKHVYSADQLSNGMSSFMADQTLEYSDSLFAQARTQIKESSRQEMMDLKQSPTYQQANRAQKNFMIAKANANKDYKNRAVDMVKAQMTHNMLGDDLGSMTMQGLSEARTALYKASDNKGYLEVKSSAVETGQLAEQNDWWRIDKHFDASEQNLKNAGRLYKDGFDFDYDQQTGNMNIAQNTDEVRVYRVRDQDADIANDSFLTMKKGQFVNMANVRKSDNKADYRLNDYDFSRGADFKRNLSSDLNENLEVGQLVNFKNQEFILDSNVEFLSDLNQQVNVEVNNGAKWYAEGHDSLTVETQPNGQTRVKGTIEIFDGTNSETEFKKKVHIDQILTKGMTEFKQFETVDADGNALNSGFSLAKGNIVNPLDNDKFELKTKEGTYFIETGSYTPKVKFQKNDGKKETVQMQKSQDMYYVKLGEKDKFNDYIGLTEDELKNKAYVDTVHEGQAYRLNLSYNHNAFTGDTYDIDVSRFSVKGVMSDTTKSFTVDQALDLIDSPDIIAQMYENSEQVQENLDALNLEEIREGLENVKFDETLTDNEYRYDQAMEIFAPIMEAIIEPQIRAHENQQIGATYREGQASDKVRFKSISIKQRGSITGPDGNAVAAQVQGDTLAIDASFFVMDTTNQGKQKFELDLGSVYNAGEGAHEIQHNIVAEMSRQKIEAKDKAYYNAGVNTVTDEKIQDAIDHADEGENFVAVTGEKLIKKMAMEKKTIDRMGEIEVSEEVNHKQLEKNVGVTEAAFDEVLRKTAEDYENGQQINVFDQQKIFRDYLASNGYKSTKFDPGEYEDFLVSSYEKHAVTRMNEIDNAPNGMSYAHHTLEVNDVGLLDGGGMNIEAADDGVALMASDIATPYMIVDNTSQESLDLYARHDNTYKVGVAGLDKMASLSVDGKVEEDVNQVLRDFFVESGISPENGFKIDLHRAHGISTEEYRSIGAGHAGIKKTNDTFKEGEIIAREITITDLKTGVMMRIERPAVVGKDETKLMGTIPASLPKVSVNARAPRQTKTVEDFEKSSGKTMVDLNRQAMEEVLDGLERDKAPEDRRIKKAVYQIAKMLGKNIEDLDFEIGEMKENELLVRYLSLVDTLDYLVKNKDKLALDGEKYADTLQGGAFFSMIGRVFGMDHTDIVDIIAFYKTLSTEELIQRVYDDVGVNWEVSVSESDKKELVTGFNKVLKDNMVVFKAYGSTDLKDYQDAARTAGSLNYEADFFVETTKEEQQIIHLKPSTLTKNTITEKNGYSQINVSSMKNDGVELETLIKTLYRSLSAYKSEADVKNEFNELMVNAKQKNSKRLISSIDTFVAEKTETENPINKYLLSLKKSFTDSENAAFDMSSLLDQVKKDVYQFEDKDKLIKKIEKLWTKAAEKATGSFDLVSELESLLEYEMELSDAEKMRLLQEELVVFQILPAQAKQRYAKTYNMNVMVELLKDNGLFENIVSEASDQLTASSAVKADAVKKIHKKSQKLDNSTKLPEEEDMVAQYIKNLRKMIDDKQADPKLIDQAIDEEIVDAKLGARLKAMSPQLFNLSVMQNAITQLNESLAEQENQLADKKAAVAAEKLAQAKQAEDLKAREQKAKESKTKAVETQAKAIETTVEAVQEEVQTSAASTGTGTANASDNLTLEDGLSTGGGATETIGSSAQQENLVAEKIEFAQNFEQALDIFVAENALSREETEPSSVFSRVKTARLNVPRTSDVYSVSAGFRVLESASKKVATLNEAAMQGLAKQAARSSNPGSCVRSTSMIIDVFGVIIEINMLLPIGHISGVFVNRYEEPVTEIVIKSKDGMTQAQFLSTLTAVQFAQAMAESFTDSMLFGYHAAANPSERSETVDKAITVYNDTAVKGLLPTMLTAVSLVNQFSEQSIATTAKFNKMFGFGYKSSRQNKDKTKEELIVKDKFNSVEEALEQWKELFAKQVIESEKAKVRAQTAADVENDDYIEKISSALTKTAQEYFKMKGSASELRKAMREVRQSAKEEAASAIKMIKEAQEKQPLATDNEPVKSAPIDIFTFFFLWNKIRDPQSLIPARFRNTTPPVQPQVVPMGKAPEDKTPKPIKLAKP